MNTRKCALAELMAELKNKINGVTVVLVSGDCGFFSVSQIIVRDFSEQYDIELVNGISSIQYFSAKIAVSYDDALICSMHGKNNIMGTVPKAAYNKKVFALTGGAFKAHDICGILCNSGLSDIKIIIGESDGISSSTPLPSRTKNGRIKESADILVSLTIFLKIPFPRSRLGLFLISPINL